MSKNEKIPERWAEINTTNSLICMLIKIKLLKVTIDVSFSASAVCDSGLNLIKTFPSKWHPFLVLVSTVSLIFFLIFYKKKKKKILNLNCCSLIWWYRWFITIKPRTDTGGRNLSDFEEKGDDFGCSRCLIINNHEFIHILLPSVSSNLIGKP